MKTCTKCKIEHEDVNFYYRSKSKSLRHSWCIPCMKELKSWKQYQRKYSLKKRYDLTIEDYNRMLISQEYKCKICGTTDTGSRTNFAVDHDHTTGDVRGLLCDRCNHGLGNFKDNVEFLKQAIEYLTGETQKKKGK